MWPGMGSLAGWLHLSDLLSSLPPRAGVAQLLGAELAASTYLGPSRGVHSPVPCPSPPAAPLPREALDRLP